MVLDKRLRKYRKLDKSRGKEKPLNSTYHKGEPYFLLTPRGHKNQLDALDKVVYQRQRMDNKAFMKKIGDRWYVYIRGRK